MSRSHTEILKSDRTDTVIVPVTRYVPTTRLTGTLTLRITTKPWRPADVSTD